MLEIAQAMKIWLITGSKTSARNGSLSASSKAMANHKLLDSLVHVFLAEHHIGMYYFLVNLKANPSSNPDYKKTEKGIIIFGLLCEEKSAQEQRSMLFCFTNKNTG